MDAVPIEDEQEKIIHGKGVSSDYFPYMVSLGRIKNQPTTKEQRQKLSELYKMDHHFCGGVLIHDQWVLTAAHCVVDGKTKQARQASDIGVGIGTNDLVEMYELGRIPASQIIFPNEYDPNYFYHDLAIVRLSTPVSKSVFATKKYATGCLGIVNNNTTQQASGPLYSMGWGNNVRFQNHPNTNSWGPVSYPRYLQYIPTKDVTGSDPACKGRNDMVCTFAEFQGTGACRGDSGGPVITQNHAILGMLSYGNPDQNGVYCNGDAKYARVGLAFEWIHQNIKQNFCYKNVN